MNPSLLPPLLPSYRLIIGRLSSLTLVSQTEKGNSEFKRAVLHLENDLVSHPTHGGEVGYIHILCPSLTDVSLKNSQPPFEYNYHYHFIDKFYLYFFFFFAYQADIKNLGQHIYILKLLVLDKNT